jgi:hypothetical protein
MACIDGDKYVVFNLPFSLDYYYYYCCHYFIFLSYRGSLTVKNFPIDALNLFTLAAAALLRLPVVLGAAVVSHPALAIFIAYVGPVLSKVAPC